ncbi:hypothetical protein OQA88_29 [Cercophora sp. LCS_1]
MPLITDNNKFMKQYVATKKGGPFQLVNVSYPIPEPDEICIRNRAVSLNPLDSKSLHHGMMVKTWPEVFGIEAAGVVEIVGSNVTRFKAGDAVMASAGLGGRRGAFQDVTAVPAHMASRKPASWSFSQACSTPICYLAATAAITKGLNTPLPHLKQKEDATKKEDVGTEYLTDRHLRNKSVYGINIPLDIPPPPLDSILVIGGSSGVGASAIQLLRLALPNATIISTNSPVHNKRLVALGAKSCVDRNLDAQKVVSAIKAASPGGKGVDAILDAVAGVGRLWDALRSDGPRLYSGVLTGQEVAVPEGVKGTTNIVAQMMFQGKEGAGVMGKLADLVDEGSYELPQEVEVVGRGLEDVGAGLEKLRKGVSGTKLVVAL